MRFVKDASAAASDEPLPAKHYGLFKESSCERSANAGMKHRHRCARAVQTIDFMLPHFRFEMRDLLKLSACFQSVDCALKEAEHAIFRKAFKRF